MLRVALSVGLLTLTAASEPRLLSTDATSVRIQEATARLIDDGTGVPDSHLTLLPEGVCFTREGYDRLVSVTTTLQEDLGKIRQRVRDYEAATLTPLPVVVPTAPGWSTKDVLLVGAVGVVVGVVGSVVLVGLRAH